MKRYFHTFDVLRFFAFLKVFLLHLPIAAFPVFTFLKNGGGIGVIFFFVLSGFLITYIIIEEKLRTSKLNLYNFYVRRILKIWPLYFLMVGFAFATPYLLAVFKLPFSNEGYQPNWLMTITFLENYKSIAEHSHPNVAPLSVIWSLCIEEHFYLLWGITFFFVSVKRIPVVIGVSIVLSIIANAVFLKINIPTAEILTNLIYFAFGAIPAYLLATRKDSFESFIIGFPRMYRFLLLCLVIIYVLLSPNINYPLKDYIEPLIFGLLFCSIICLIIPQDNDIKISDKNILSKFGIYTYGLYLYHTIVISLFIHVFKKVGLSLDKPIDAIAFVGLTLGITLLISYLSYNLFEKPFLRLKTYFY